MTKDEISAFMREMGRRGGMIGGKRSAERLTPAERTLRAQSAARARWGKWPVLPPPVGTIFSYQLTPTDAPWLYCVVGHVTKTRVYFGYPLYDRDDHRARRMQLDDWTARLGTSIRVARYPADRG